MIYLKEETSKLWSNPSGWCKQLPEPEGCKPMEWAPS